MLPQGTEGAARVARHRAQRAHLSCQTLELPYHVAAAKLPTAATVLLEDVSNLLANNLFAAKGQRHEVLSDIVRLAENCATLIAVSISGLQALDYDGETADYIRELNLLNAEIAQRADKVIEMPLGENDEPVATIMDSHQHL
jgi:adenosylcobinamide kinase/adenosylcobinamide-phosphate guanylyltransferase